MFRSSAQRAGLEIHEDRAGHIAIMGSPLQLHVGVTVVGTGGVDAVLVGESLRKQKQ